VKIYLHSPLRIREKVSPLANMYTCRGAWLRTETILHLKPLITIAQMYVCMYVYLFRRDSNH